MKNLMTTLIVSMVMMAWPGQFCEAVPMGMAFTYQGHLYDANYVANGLYDFQFALYDSNDPCVGSPIGSDVNKPEVDVIDGYFTVELDFGSGVFDGNAVWLEIGVRPGVENDPNEYTPLSPRQEVTPTPYAIYAETSGGDNDWMVSGDDMYSIPDGNVGIGTDTPGAKLDVEVSSGGAATIGSSLNSAAGDYAIAMGSGTTASGYGSTAMGSGTTASGQASTAMGYGTTASRSYSTAMGSYTEASEDYSTAMGYYTTSSGGVSTAMGYQTDANGHASTAMGYYTTSSGDASTAMGRETTASGYGSTAMGHSTDANGQASTAMGRETTASGVASTAMGYDTTANGYYSTAMGHGTDANGHFSTAMGYDTTASGYGSTAMGRDIEAAGDYSVAIALDDMNGAQVTQDNTMAIMGGNVGVGTVSPSYPLDVNGTVNAIGFVGDGSGLTNLSGDSDWMVSGDDMYSIPDGNVGIGTDTPGAKLDVEVSSGGAATIGSIANSATGDYAIAMGYGTDAIGFASTAMGVGTTATVHGGYSTAMGWGTTSSGQASTAMGSGTTASGGASTAMGQGTTAIGGVSTAMGYDTTASGNYSTAMGYHTTSGGISSTAMGHFTTASGTASTAMGQDTTAIGGVSTAMGYDTTASGDYSTAMGREIEAAGDYSVAIALADMNGAQVTQNNTMAIMGGRVGIGTTSPGAKLFVEESGSATPLRVRVSGMTKLIVLNDGRVGIGTASPGYTLHVVGNIAYTGSIYDISDLRLKENITPLENGVEKVSCLKGIYFNNKGDSPDKREVGVIAQDVEKVLPELVSMDKEGYKSVDYTKLTPVLIEAVKELKSENDELQEQNNRLESRLSALENAMRSGSLIGKEL